MILPREVETLYGDESVKVYPVKDMVFRALKLCPIERCKVVIVGQDCYHQAGQADGLAFSVPVGCVVPPSLRNILKEVKRSVNVEKDLRNGNLEAWAQQGVLLLNRALTVEHGKPNSHKKYWHAQTRALIEKVASENPFVVAMLWGREARGLRDVFTSDSHLVLEWTHPSPLARAPFVGCNHFVLANEHLVKHGTTPIEW